MRFVRFLCMAGMLLASMAVNAISITFTFSGVDGEINFDGAGVANHDLTIQLTGDTDNLVVGGALGGDLYASLQPFYSSASLGFSMVAGNDLLDVVINPTAFGATFANGVYLRLGAAVNGLFAGQMPATLAWDRVSDIGPLLAVNGATGPVSTSLSTGETLVWANLDGAPPFGDATFQARLPEPAAVSLVALGLLGVSCVRRRRVR